MSLGETVTFEFREQLEDRVWEKVPFRSGNAVSQPGTANQPVWKDRACCRFMTLSHLKKMIFRSIWKSTGELRQSNLPDVLAKGEPYGNWRKILQEIIAAPSGKQANSGSS